VSVRGLDGADRAWAGGGVLRRFPSATTLVLIRVAYFIGLAAAGLWTPVHHGIHHQGAYTPLGDLLFGTLNRWDAGWFMRIALHGYDTKQTAAFFPVYPLLLRGVAFVVRSHLVAGVLISLVAAAITAELLFRIARTRLGERASRDAILLFALYPLSFVLMAVYSDAVFLLFATASFYAAQRGRGLTAGVAGGLAVGTRLLGLALLPALVILLWRRGVRGLAPLVLLPAALGLYALYLHRHFGDWLAWQHAEQGFWQRHTSSLGPITGTWDVLKSFEQGAANILRHLPPELGAPTGYGHAYVWSIWNVVHFLLFAAAIWLTWLAWKRLGAAFAAYSATTLLVIVGAPTAVIPLGSIPRFLLADFPIFLVLGDLVATRPRLRETLLVAFGSIGAAAAVAFAHGAWVA
jgi:mannosyltransferase PIG-V